MNLVQVAQRAEDLARATQCYRVILQAEPLASFDPPGLVFFDLGGTRLLLEQGANSALLYLRVDNIDAEVERLRNAGLAVVAEPQVIFAHPDDTLGPAGTQEWMAFVTDSEGNTVGLVEQRVA